MNELLQVENLSKDFGGFALRQVSFALPKGYIMGLIGPNGSGKTTTIKLILNMLRPSGGEIRLLGQDSVTGGREARAQVGVVFDSNCFCAQWTAAQAGRAVSGFYPNWDGRRFSRMLERFSIAPGKRVKELSKGMQMKLMLACAFSHDAKLLILDEPTGGLDPVSREELLELLAEYIEDGEHSVLFSTHITQDLERVADFITYLNGGELFYTGGKDEFLEMFRLVKGGTGQLTDGLRQRALGLRTFPTGFEALIKTQDAGGFPGLLAEPATLHEIVVFTSRKEEYHG